MKVLGKLLKELGGILSYIYLLQSSIDYLSQVHPIESDITVYRGLSSDGHSLSELYDSMIGELIVWRGFTSTSRNFQYVINRFVRDDRGILFEIVLHPGDVAADIRCYSEYRNESEVLIASSSIFRVVSVDQIVVRNQGASDSQLFRILKVTLHYEMSWFDFRINKRPPSFLV
jgi:hypothetical protein